MVRPTLKTQKPNLQEAIKETAWKQIAETGAASLSLRSIARELGITAPAIYNYYPDRDALVTALIIDAYTSFGDYQLASCDAQAEEDIVGKLRATCFAYRQWALEYPQRYQLIFGTPIPGYEAPRMEVMPSAARSLIASVSVIDKLRVVNKLSAEGFPAVQPGYEQITDLWRSFGGNYDILSLSVAMIIWSRVHGLVSLEISNSMPPIGMDNASLYRYEIESIVRQFVKGD